MNLLYCMVILVAENQALFLKLLMMYYYKFIFILTSISHLINIMDLKMKFMNKENFLNLFINII